MLSVFFCNSIQSDVDLRSTDLCREWQHSLCHGLCLKEGEQRRELQPSGARKAMGHVLKLVEQTDLMTYGLIPEFVGRFPIVTTLQVSSTSCSSSCVCTACHGLDICYNRHHEVVYALSIGAAD